MKKFLRMFALALFVAVAGVALAACGAKGPTEKDIEGVWYTESQVETIGDNEPTTYTFARLKELHDAGQTGEDEYLDLLSYLPMIKATADGQLQWKYYYDDESDYVPAGTWEIKDGKLEANVDTLLGGEKEVEYKDGKIIITQTNGNTVTIFTLVKLA